MRDAFVGFTGRLDSAEERIAEPKGITCKLPKLKNCERKD